MITVTRQDLNALIDRARQGTRRRQNLNIHQALDDPINRLLNAVEPDSYIRPHRHPDKVETLLAVAGRFEVIFFDERGTLSTRVPLGGEGAVLVEYPANAWHSLIALEPGSSFFEVKAGPYAPTNPEDFLAGWPLENSAGVAEALNWLRSAKPGDGFFKPLP